MAKKSLIVASRKYITGVVDQNIIFQEKKIECLGADGNTYIISASSSFLETFMK